MKVIRKIIYPLTIILLIFIFVCIFYIKNNLNKNKYNDSEIITNIVKQENVAIDEEEITKYNVDIKGAVKNPGVYHIDSNLTVNDAIVLAGGLNKDADTSVINLAKKITNEMVIIVYTTINFY